MLSDPFIKLPDQPTKLDPVIFQSPVNSQLGSGKPVARHPTREPQNLTAKATFKASFTATFEVMSLGAPPSLVYYDGYFRACDLLPGTCGNPSRFQARERTLAVYIDGACRGNGTYSTRGSWGLYFGPNSTLNRCGMLSQNVPQTSNRAEIQALAQAVGHIFQVARSRNIDDAWILTDSTYIVDSINVWIHKWIQNDGCKSNGQEAAYYYEIWVLHRLIKGMKVHYGVDIHVRHVGREDNQGADSLANRALDNNIPKRKDGCLDWVLLMNKKETMLGLRGTDGTIHDTALLLGYNPGIRMAAASLFPPL